MKVNLEIKDLNLLLSALSLGVNFIGEQTFTNYIGCEEHRLIKKLFDKYNITNYQDQEKLLKERFEALKDIYEQFLEIEKKGSDYHRTR